MAPSMEFFGEKKQISLMTSDHEHMRLQAESVMTGLNVSQIVHVLVEMMKLRTTAAKAKGLEIPTGLSSVELFVLLIAQDCKLLSDEEIKHAFWAAENYMGPDFKARVVYLFGLIESRMDKILPPREERIQAIFDEQATA